MSNFVYLEASSSKSAVSVNTLYSFSLTFTTFENTVKIVFSAPFILNSCLICR